MIEEWRPVVGYEGLYEVSNLGRVQRLDGFDTLGHPLRGRILAPVQHRNGYLFVSLSKGTTKIYAIHRLVAETFLGKSEGKTEVNHINEIKTDNRAENLEWVTKSENHRSGTMPQRKRYGNLTQMRAVLQIDDSGKIIREYLSVGEAERQLGIHHSAISRCCAGKREHAGGYCWKYKE